MSIISVIQTHPSCGFHLAVDFPGLRRSGSSSQFIYLSQEFPKQAPGHGDFGDLARQEPVVYSVGETARWGGDVLMPSKANCPVIVGGVTIIPGDYTYADASGAVILPATPVDQILDEAARIEQNDAKFFKHIRDEDRERVLKNSSGES